MTIDHGRQTAMRRPIRHGLSPLEFVLALPMLLFVMALMLNFGTVASWKVRTLGAARHAAWSTRAPRSGMQYPRPANWPPAANLGAGGAGDQLGVHPHVIGLDEARGHPVRGEPAHSEAVLDCAVPLGVNDEVGLVLVRFG
ncbi:MAG: pilus assembly protein, partial [Thermoguttaceae bacterium]|nr:pilus assembly protein [Thermoguttaceae bacterium]